VSKENKGFGRCTVSFENKIQTGISSCYNAYIHKEDTMERKGDVTFKGNPLTLIGPKVEAGQKAPDFKALAKDLSEKSLSSFKGKIKLIASVPSLDTPVCDLEIKRFNKEAAGISKDVAVIFVSMDLPFAQSRFCQEFEIEKVETLSDHRDASFGENFGALIKELRLLARAIFIIDKSDKVRYVEYVKEISSHPDYDAALKALKSIA
jgi:thioredoxin-dependent peroxiredoxin